MTNLSQSQKLEALVQRAIDGGWDFYGDLDLIYAWDCYPEDVNTAVTLDYKNSSGDEWHLNKLIFDHHFARALWSNEDVDTGTNVTDEYDHVIYRPAWEYHLQQMVISEDPIDYAYRSIFNV